jgi:hypothetical protein
MKRLPSIRIQRSMPCIVHEYYASSRQLAALLQKGTVRSGDCPGWGNVGSRDDNFLCGLKTKYAYDILEGPNIFTGMGVRPLSLLDSLFNGASERLKA